MKSIKKKLRKIVLRFKLKENQSQIIERSREIQNFHLKPVLPDGGSIEHYYHFIFDLLLPLSILINKTPRNVIFKIDTFGVFESLFLEIFGNRVNIINNKIEISPNTEISLLGMNPLAVNLSRKEIENFKNQIFSKLNIEPSFIKNKIILIERVAPSSFYANEAKLKGGGSSRRSILNHEELRKAISSMVHPNYEFLNLKLEKLTFNEQIKLFSEAAVVIGQHGAGLSNMLWMKKESVVVEFGLEKKPHFKVLSSLKRNKNIYLNYVENHINVDIEFLSSILLNNTDTRKYFVKV